MARFGMENADNYGGQGGGGFFRLVNDGDTAVVRFLYNSVEDVEGYAVHEIKLNDKKRYVNCLREYNQPLDDCPFCRDRQKQLVKVFVPVYNVSEDTIQIWERGKKFFQKMSSLCSRYATKTNLVASEFEIERNGKAGDTATTYEIYRTDTPTDDSSTDDYDMPQILGKLVLDKTADDMETYLETGQFPPEDGEEEKPVVRRRGTARETTSDDAPRRRTPNRREAF